MLPRNHPDRIRIVFDDHRLVANAGLLLPATLARHLGLRELVDHHLDLGGAPGRANTGDKLMTLVASAMAGGDCWMDGAADVAETTCTPFQSEPDAAPVVRRRSQSLPAATEDRHRPPSTPNRARTIALPCPYRPFRCCIVIPSVDLGLATDSATAWLSPVSIATSMPMSCRRRTASPLSGRTASARAKEAIIRPSPTR